MTDYSEFDRVLKKFKKVPPGREIKINFAPLIGAFLALYAAYILWGGLGAMFTTGLLMQSWAITLTFKKRL